jgi:hypothetical protein
MSRTKSTAAAQNSGATKSSPIILKSINDVDALMASPCASCSDKGDRGQTMNSVHRVFDHIEFQCSKNLHSITPSLRFTISSWEVTAFADQLRKDVDGYMRNSSNPNFDKLKEAEPIFYKMDRIRIIAVFTPGESKLETKGLCKRCLSSGIVSDGALNVDHDGKNDETTFTCVREDAHISARSNRAAVSPRYFVRKGHEPRPDVQKPKHIYSQRKE